MREHERECRKVRDGLREQDIKNEKEHVKENVGQKTQAETRQHQHSRKRNRAHEQEQQREKARVKERKRTYERTGDGEHYQETRQYSKK